jgi:hypothetical protein
MNTPHKLTPGKQGGNLFGTRRDPPICWPQDLRQHHLRLHLRAPGMYRVACALINPISILAVIFGSIIMVVGLMACWGV